jgi:hypothetical protein
MSEIRMLTLHLLLSGTVLSNSRSLYELKIHNNFNLLNVDAGQDKTSWSFKDGVQLSHCPMSNSPTGRAAATSTRRDVQDRLKHLHKLYFHRPSTGYFG